VRNRSFFDHLSYGVKQVLFTPIFALTFLAARWRARLAGGCCGGRERRKRSRQRACGTFLNVEECEATHGPEGMRLVRLRARDSGVIKDASFVVMEATPQKKSSRRRIAEPSGFERCSQNLRVPLNRLISHCASLVAFFVWVLLTQLNPSDDEAKWDPDFYDIFAGVWALGYICADMQVRDAFEIETRTQSFPLRRCARARPIGEPSTEATAAIPRFSASPGGSYPIPSWISDWQAISFSSWV